MKRSQVGKISKALADETRLRIFEAISATDHMNCGEIVSMRRDPRNRLSPSQDSKRSWPDRLPARRAVRL